MERTSSSEPAAIVPLCPAIARLSWRIGRSLSRWWRVTLPPPSPTPTAISQAIGSHISTPVSLRSVRPGMVSFTTGRLPIMKVFRARRICNTRAAIRFHRRMSVRGHRLLDTDAIVLLANDGDELAREMLVNAAYRGPDGFDIGPVSGILHLLETDPDETYFASTRLLVRHRRPEAVRLLFRIDKDRAWGELLPRYRRFPASLRAEIGRNFRAHASADTAEPALGALAVSGDAADRRTAAELAGWMPPATRLPWLSGLVGDEDAAVRNEAIDALRRRRLELAALGHLATLPSSAKHLQWLRPQTLFDLVDQRFFRTQGDQLSLGPFLEDAAQEFWVEAKKLKDKREKAVADATWRRTRTASSL